MKVYLDHAATTQPEEAVIHAMTDAMRCAYANPSSAYGAAGEARRIARLCRMQLAQMLSCTQQEICFTSGGTEANNWAVRAFAGRHMVVSSIEHASVLEAAKRLAGEVTWVAPDASGAVSAEAVLRAVRPDTALVCLQAANNETGVLQPVQAVYESVRARGIHLHVDAVQAFGHVPVCAACCDSMSLSAHKLYGPRGIGALYIRQGKRLAPVMLGGHQEKGLRAGTENTPAIAGFCAAAKLAQADMAERACRERNLLEGFAAEIRAAVPKARVLGEAAARLPGILALLLPGVESEMAIAKLDLRGVMVSGGAACASGSVSHVYGAMGLDRAAAACVLRISVGRHTTAQELRYAAEQICEICALHGG